jgi:hypothetical protein
MKSRCRHIVVDKHTGTKRLCKNKTDSTYCATHTISLPIIDVVTDYLVTDNLVTDDLVTDGPGIISDDNVFICGTGQQYARYYYEKKFPISKYNKCCFCGRECNPGSQSCGTCARINTTMYWGNNY